MVDLSQLQKRVYKNKIDKGFNTTDIYMEFCYAYGELNEAREAYSKKKDDIGEEIADVVIYLLGLSEILGINLQEELIKKIEINEKRTYIDIGGVKVKKD